MITVTINKKPTSVEDGTTVAAAILNSSREIFLPFIKGARRGPLCGIGICFECRVTINGARHERSCMLPAAAGMEIETGE